MVFMIAFTVTRDLHPSLLRQLNGVTLVAVGGNKGEGVKTWLKDSASCLTIEEHEPSVRSRGCEG